jgi:gluconokinase
MGVSGSGQDNGRAPARRLGWLFQEGDAPRPPENVAKMKAGHPLTTEDRALAGAAIAATIDAAGTGRCRDYHLLGAEGRYRDTIIGNRPTDGWCTLKDRGN